MEGTGNSLYDSVTTNDYLMFSSEIEWAASSVATSHGKNYEVSARTFPLRNT